MGAACGLWSGRIAWRRWSVCIGLRGGLVGWLAVPVPVMVVGCGGAGLGVRRGMVVARWRGFLAQAAPAGSPRQWRVVVGGGMAGGGAGARDRHQFPAVDSGAGLGGGHFCVLRRTDLGRAHGRPQAGAEHQSGQELGRCLGRHGGRGGAGVLLALGRYRAAAPGPQFVQPPARWQTLARDAGRGMAGGHERSGRLG